MTPKVLTIGEVATQFDITLRTLRFYEIEGLVKPLRKGSVRLYNDAQQARLQSVLDLKKLGFTLKEIKAVLASRSSKGAEKIASSAARSPSAFLSAAQVLAQIEHLEFRRSEIEAGADRASCDPGKADVEQPFAVTVRASCDAPISLLERSVDALTKAEQSLTGSKRPVAPSKFAASGPLSRIAVQLASLVFSSHLALQSASLHVCPLVRVVCLLDLFRGLGGSCEIYRPDRQPISKSSDPDGHLRPGLLCERILGLL